MLFGGEGDLDRRSILPQIGLVILAVLLFMAPSVPGWHGDPERHTLYLITIPVAVCLLLVYLGVTVRNLRRFHAEQQSAPAHDAWSLKTALLALGAATVATAFVSELLVHTLNAFGQALGLSQFFVAVVIVAIVGNAAEHGGALVVAYRGNMPLASEIAVSSAAQVAVFITPVIALVSWLVGPGLPLAFRPVELVTMAIASVMVLIVAADARSRSLEGVALVGVYALMVVWYAYAGDR
jgi:Ca2+:H+ antiporter